MESTDTEDVALTVQEARRYFRPPPSDQTIYRLVWSGRLKVLDQPGVMRIPLSELRKFFGKTKVYQSRRQLKRKAVAQES